MKYFSTSYLYCKRRSSREVWLELEFLFSELKKIEYPYIELYKRCYFALVYVKAPSVNLGYVLYYLFII